MPELTLTSGRPTANGDRASPLERKADVVLAASGARILRVTFVGKHHYSHGAEMSSQLQAAVGAERPDGVLVDLLEYEYEFGNDVCGLFIAGWHSKSQTLVPTCIVASGKTRASVENLYSAGNFKLEPYVGFADSVSEGLAWLSEARGRRTSGCS